jgi:hypothetical protein
MIEVSSKARVEHVALFVPGGEKKVDVVLLIERVVCGQFVGAEHLAFDA